MRPVIRERASACIFPSFASRGTKYRTNSRYASSQSANGASSQGSEPSNYQADGHKIDDEINQDVRDDHPGVAYRQCGLHDLGRHPAGKLVLVETQALREHVAMENPTLSRMAKLLARACCLNRD